MIKKIGITCFLYFFSTVHVGLAAPLPTNDQEEYSMMLNEIKKSGLKPTDLNIYNMCFASSLLIINAANDAVSGQYSGDHMIGDILLIPHDEYRMIVKELIKNDAVEGIKRNTEYFDKNFQMKCRASPETYIKKYNEIFRLKMSESDLKNQW